MEILASTRQSQTSKRTKTTDEDDDSLAVHTNASPATAVSHENPTKAVTSNNTNADDTSASAPEMAVADVQVSSVSPTTEANTAITSTCTSEDVQDEHMMKQCNKPKTKYQNRYEPPTSMTKEQAAEWRREARRKRNRESAAASRNKVRSRITELEGEVDDWKNKYASLLQRIESLERRHNLHHDQGGVGALGGAGISSSSAIGVGAIQPQTHTHGQVSPCSTPISTLDIIDAIQVPLNLSVPSIESSFATSSPQAQAETQTQVQASNHDNIASVTDNASTDTDTTRTSIMNKDTQDFCHQDDHDFETTLNEALAANDFHVIEMNSRPA
jgi:hypothetical protein